ncbi:hypothetical protein FB451DRAFT_1368571 [Mycena latifolia]|nr:hypothetical protein FB451DRAFT_1368571 [Mycena latifolia]
MDFLECNRPKSPSYTKNRHALTRFTEDDFEAHWMRGCSKQGSKIEREEFILEGLVRTCQVSSEYEGYRSWCPEITLKRLNHGSGKGFINLLNQLRYQNFDDFPPHYNTVPNAVFEKNNSVGGPNLHTGCVIISKMLEGRRTYFLTMVVLLAFYGESKEYGRKKQKQPRQDTAVLKHLVPPGVDVKTVSKGPLADHPLPSGPDHWAVVLPRAIDGVNFNLCMASAVCESPRDVLKMFQLLEPMARGVGFGVENLKKQLFHEYRVDIDAVAHERGTTFLWVWVSLCGVEVLYYIDQVFHRDRREKTRTEGIHDVLESRRHAHQANFRCARTNFVSAFVRPWIANTSAAPQDAAFFRDQARAERTCKGVEVLYAEAREVHQSPTSTLQDFHQVHRAFRLHEEMQQVI